MQTLCFFILLAALLRLGPSPVGVGPGYLPVPDDSPHRLFYLQRSKDRNTVIYEANVAANQKLNPRKPVQVYWIRYAEGGQREDLSRLQWQMAYGYTHKPSVSGSDDYELSLNAFGKRPLQVVFYQGKFVAMILIQGQRACLQKVFVQLNPDTRLVPQVRYIELYGNDPTTGRCVYERIIP
jgi:hypothetical protein